MESREQLALDDREMASLISAGVAGEKMGRVGGEVEGMM